MTQAVKLWAIGRITVRSRMRYLWDLMGSTIFLAVVMFVFVRLWTVTYSSDAAKAGGSTSGSTLGMMAGFSLPQMIWYFVATEIIIMSMLPIHRAIEREIKDGDVAIRLNKPYSFLGYHWSVFLGEGVMRGLILLFVGGSVAMAMIGPIAFRWDGVPALIATFFFTATLNFQFGSMIGLLAFWTEDITGFYFILDRAKWLLGGFLMPITLYPDWLQQIVHWLPFPLMIYKPAHLAVAFDWIAWVELSLKQVALIVLFYAMSNGMYRLGVRRLDVNGG